MATLMTALVAGSATAGAAAGGTAAAAGGAAAATAATGFSFTKALTAGAGILSGFGALMSGQAQAEGLEAQAEFEKFNIKQEELKGQAEAIEALQEANRTAAAARASGFAAGLRGEGSANRAVEAAIDDGEFQIGFARDNAAIRAGGRRARAASLRADARASRVGGAFGAIDAITNTYLDFRRIG